MEIYEIAVFNYLHCWAAGLLRFYVWISRRLNSFWDCGWKLLSRLKSQLQVEILLCEPFFGVMTGPISVLGRERGGKGNTMAASWLMLQEREMY